MRSYLKTAVLIFLLSGHSVISADNICGYAPDAKVTVTASQKENLSFVTGIADDTVKHQKGLMDCASLKKGTGLFFIFEDDAPRYFWMKNTSIELAVIYIDRDFRIVSIRRGTPLSEKTMPSIFPARYVLEINWNESLKMKPGDKVSFAMN